MENRDPYFEKFINLTVDFIVSEVKDKLKEFNPVNEDEKLMYKPKEAMKILGVGSNTIYELLKEDEFPKIMIGNNYYIPKAELQEWISKQCKK